jgi:hypothetical protein
MVRSTHMAKKPRYQKFEVELPSGQLSLYAGTKIRSALLEVTMNMDLYHGVRLGEVLQAVHEQGMKDGRREVIEQMETIRDKTNYLPPGRPKKKRSRRN